MSPFTNTNNVGHVPFLNLNYLIYEVEKMSYEESYRQIPGIRPDSEKR